MMPEVELKNVCRYYGTVSALADISWSGSPGDCVLLQGANGAGKSTLLRLLAGIERADSGTVRVAGCDLNSGAGWRSFRSKVRVGVFLQQLLLYDELTISENIALYAGLYNVVPEAENKMRRLFELFDIRADAGKKFGHCSQGVRQKASLVRALIHDPEVIFLDEPFANLDLCGCDALVELLEEAKSRGAIVVTAGHESARMLSLAQKFILLDAGRLKKSGSMSGEEELRNA